MATLRRRKALDDDDLVAPKFIPKAALKRLKKLDVFPKIAEEQQVQTGAGGVVSLVSIVAILVLVCGELATYMSSATEEQILLDPTVKEKLRINFDLSFHDLTCAAVHLDAMDVAGDQQLVGNGLIHDIQKYRLSASGEQIGSAFKHTMDEDDLLRKTHARDYCGSCYGAETDARKCCNTCDAVKAAYVEKGWNAASVMATAEQCVAQREKAGLISQEGEGCRLAGYLLVNKVAGNFHVAMGETHIRDGRHIHQFNPTEIPDFNVSHTVNHLSFGPHYPGVHNPLDGVVRMIGDGPGQSMRGGDTGAGVFQYFVQIVPTEYVSGFGIFPMRTSQYTYTYQYHPAVVKGERQNILPGVFFVYDLSPFMMRVQPASPSFFQFLTGLFAVVGGVLTITGLVDGLLYRGQNLFSIMEKAGLKKGSKGGLPAVAGPMWAGSSSGGVASASVTSNGANAGGGVLSQTQAVPVVAKEEGQADEGGVATGPPRLVKKEGKKD